MSKFIDLTGQRFGRLVPIKYCNDKYKWECQCDCGTIKLVSSSNLTSGNTKSCGCLRKENTKAMFFCNIMGKKFGRWTVTEYKGTDKWNHALWECKCDCGTIRIVHGKSLRRGESQSCGCLKAEKTRERSIYHIPYKGYVYSITEWSQLTGIKANTLVQRFRRGNWTPAEAFNTPVGEPIPIEKRIL